MIAPDAHCAGNGPSSDDLFALAPIRGGIAWRSVLGGNRSAGQYARFEAHGFYWTSSDNDPASAPFYNFGQNGGALHRQPNGDKQMAISVRCVRE